MMHETDNTAVILDKQPSGFRTELVNCKGYPRKVSKGTWLTGFKSLCSSCVAIGLNVTLKLQRFVCPMHYV